MSFSVNSGILRSGKIYGQSLHPKMSLNTENTAKASEEINAVSDRISPKLIDERIGANLEPLKEQIATLTRLLNELI